MWFQAQSRHSFERDLEEVLTSCSKWPHCPNKIFLPSLPWEPQSKHLAWCTKAHTQANLHVLLKNTEGIQHQASLGHCNRPGTSIFLLTALALGQENLAGLCWLSPRYYHCFALLQLDMLQRRKLVPKIEAVGQVKERKERCLSDIPGFQGISLISKHCTPRKLHPNPTVSGKRHPTILWNLAEQPPESTIHRFIEPYRWYSALVLKCVTLTIQMVFCQFILYRWSSASMDAEAGFIHNTKPWFIKSRLLVMSKPEPANKWLFVWGQCDLS